jgi:hypothetical protein
MTKLCQLSASAINNCSARQSRSTCEHPLPDAYARMLLWLRMAFAKESGLSNPFPGNYSRYSCPTSNRSLLHVNVTASIILLAAKTSIW